jgi:hypothetical protein
MIASLTLQPNAYERAHDKTTDALAAIDRCHIKDAVSFLRDAVKILETELAFRDARKGGGMMLLVQSDPISDAERAAIDAFLAKKEPRRFECGLSGNTSPLLEWLERVCGIKAERLSSRNGGSTWKPYRVAGRKVSLQGLFDFVDAERSKRGLEPIRRRTA